MNHDIYLRAHTVPVDKKKSKDTRSVDDPPKWPDHALVFDCETRVSADLTLTFGFWRFCELRNGRYECVEEGIFHDDHLSAKEFDLLRKYARSTKPDTTDDGCDRLRLYSRTKFVQETLGLAIQAKALIVCFNAGFDLSRHAVDWETGKNGGWSLVDRRAQAEQVLSAHRDKGSEQQGIHHSFNPRTHVRAGKKEEARKALASRAISGRAHPLVGPSQ